MPMRRSARPTNWGMKILAIPAAVGLADASVAPPPITRIPNVVRPCSRAGLPSAFIPRLLSSLPTFQCPTAPTDTRTVVTDQIFALNSVGERVAYLPPARPRGQADSADELQGDHKWRCGKRRRCRRGTYRRLAGNSAGGRRGFISEGASTNTQRIRQRVRRFKGAELGESKVAQPGNQQIEALCLKREEIRRNFAGHGVRVPPPSSPSSRNRRHRDPPKTFELVRLLAVNEPLLSLLKK